MMSRRGYLIAVAAGIILTVISLAYLLSPARNSDPWILTSTAFSWLVLGPWLTAILAAIAFDSNKKAKK